MTACLKLMLWWQLLGLQMWWQFPWWGPLQGLVKAEAGAGKGWKLEAEVWPLKRLMRVWLRWVGRPHRRQEALLLLESSESLSCLHSVGA